MMGTQKEGLIFAVLVIPAALGWLIWQRYMNRAELPEDNESKPRKEKLKRQMSVLLPTKSPNKEDSLNERKKNVWNQYFRQNINDYSNSTGVVPRGYGYFLRRGQARLHSSSVHALLDNGIF